MKNKSYHKKWIIVATSVLLEPIKQRLIDFTSFKLSKSLYSWSALFKSTNNFGFVFFQTIWIVEFTRPNSQQPASFLWREKCFIGEGEQKFSRLQVWNVLAIVPKLIPWMASDWLVRLSCMIPLLNTSVTSHQKKKPFDTKVRKFTYWTWLLYIQPSFPPRVLRVFSASYYSLPLVLNILFYDFPLRDPKVSRLNLSRRSRAVLEWCLAYLMGATM